MRSDAEYTAVKDRALDRLFGLSGVVAVGVGGRERAGRATGERAIRVFVARKRPRGELPQDQLVPAEFEGVGTDVVDLGTPAPDPRPDLCVRRGPSGSPPGSASRLDTRKWSRLIGGAMVSSAVDPKAPGTIGGFLEHTGDPGKVYLLSNQHVLGEAPPLDHPVKADTGTRVYHPLRQDFPLERLFAGNAVGNYETGDRDTTVDIAVARLDPGVKWYADILDIGPVTGTYTLKPEEVDSHCFEVRKRGVATGYTGGTVQAVNAAYDVDGIRYSNLMIVKPHPNPGLPTTVVNHFSDHGDSGALVVDGFNRAVGIVLAGFGPDEPAAMRGWGKVLPVDVVLHYFVHTKQMPVRLATAPRARIPRVVGQPAPPTASPTPTASPPPYASPPAPGPVPLAARPRTGSAAAVLRADLGRTVPGRRLLRLWQDHGEELAGLTGRHPELADLWRANGAGPGLAELLRDLISTVRHEARRMPAAVGPVPLGEYVDRIHHAYARLAGPELRSALARSRSALPDLAGLTYAQMVEALGPAEEGRHDH
ncbi:hypothetical protein ACFWP3_01665 [Streptomyces sp. NPDC058525]|uniref:hypothetical protein n=1 Tax=Streptomyces sp. NPDC058525 TaxID=3346538 RepID=UPI00364A3CC9